MGIFPLHKPLSRSLLSSWPILSALKCSAPTWNNTHRPNKSMPPLLSGDQSRTMPSPDHPPVVSQSVQLLTPSSMSQEPPGQTMVGAKRMTDQAFNSGDEPTRNTNNESFYAWTNVPIPTSTLNPDIMCTLFLKSIYLNNFKCTKNTLIIHADCPNFPDALWFDFLLNRYIDLEKIFSGHFVLESDSPQVQSAGEPDTSVRPTAAADPGNASKNPKSI